MAADSQTHSQKNQYSFAWAWPTYSEASGCLADAVSLFSKQKCARRYLCTHARYVVQVMSTYVMECVAYIHLCACVRGCALLELSLQKWKFVCENVLTYLHVCAYACLNIGFKWVLSSHKPFLLPDFTVTDCKRRRANKRAKLTVSSD